MQTSSSVVSFFVFISYSEDHLTSTGRDFTKKLKLVQFHTYSAHKYFKIEILSHAHLQQHHHI